MRAFRRLIGGRRAESAAPDAAPEDEAIIHEVVPAIVLASQDEMKPSPDVSWMENVPITGREAAAPRREAPRVRTAPAAPAAPKASEARHMREDADFAGRPVNRPAAARPRHPFGWLVVVDGPGTGEWFVLEDGVTSLGSAEGQTVRLDFGDAAVLPDRHAAIAYDAAQHAFVLEGAARGPLRVNGIESVGGVVLRDGDVVSLGATCLRLVALCTANFSWAADKGAP